MNNDDSTTLLHRLVLEQAAATPDRTAIHYSAGGSLSYTQMAARAVAWQRELRRHGAVPGMRVAISLPRTPDLVCAVLGTLMAGCAYVPIDPRYPAAWQAFAIDDSEAGIIICDRGSSVDGLRADLPHAYPPERVPGNVPSSGAGTPAWNEASDDVAASDATAYVIYTSGSTGKSKGVLIQHANAVNFVAWAREWYSPAELEVVLFATSICFDLSVFEIFVPLSAGGAIYVVQDAFALADVPPRVPLSLINTVPSVMAELARLAAVPRGLRTVNLAGEPLGGSLVDTLYDRFGVGRVCNLYAPSETTTYSTVYVVPRGEAQPAIGTPILATEIVLLDEADAPVAQGASGEIVIAGAGVAGGYLNRPELTAQRFRTLDTPVGPLPAYRTGDRGRWRADGQLEYLGRFDNQVKIRGYRVELGHVEACLRQCTSVADCAVVDTVSDTGDRLLSAFIVAAGTEPDDAIRHARQFLAESLPAYMVPTRWTVVDTFPRLPNGKVNREALGKSGGAQSAAAHTDRGPTPAAIAAILADVLGLADLATDADFFHAGGDSHLAARATFALREAYGRRLPLAAIYSATTADALAPVLRDARPNVDSAPTGPAQRPAADDLGAVSSAQSQMLRMSGILGNTPVSNVALRFSFARTLPIARVVEAVSQLARHHPLLMAAIDDDRWVRTAAGRLPQTEIRDVGGEPSPRVDALCHAFAAEPVGMPPGPFWRAGVFHSEGAVCRLVLVFHHVLVDESALHCLVDDLSGLLSGTAVARPETGWAPPAQPDKAALAWWRTASRDHAPWALPRDAQAATADMPSHRSQRVEHGLSRELSRRVADAARRRGLTVYELLLGTLSEVLARYSASARPVLGVIVSTRDEHEQLGTIGYRCNLLPLLLPSAAGGDWDTRLEAVGRAMRDVQTHRLVDAAEIQRLASPLTVGTELLPVRFGMMRDLRTRSVPGAWDVDELDLGVSEALLNFQARRLDDHLALRVDGRVDAFEPATLAWFVEQWVANLERVASPTAGLAATQGVNASWQAMPQDEALPSVTAAFEAVVRRKPHAPAIRNDGIETSYAALRLASRRIAVALREALPADGRVVAVHCRNVENAVGAFLACLRIGVTFVPINPAETRDRAAEICRIVGARHVLVDAPLRAGDSFDGDPRRIDVTAMITDADDRGDPSIEGSPLASDAPAYVLFTSGSTGRPKGVAQSESALVHHITTYIRSIGMRSSDLVSLLPSVGYDAAFMDVFGALLSGACLLPWDVAGKGFGGIHEWMMEEPVSVLHTTPTLFRAVFSGAPGHADFPMLRRVVLGGEKAFPKDLELFKKRCAPSARLVNGYGPTESTMALQATYLHDDACSLPTLPVGMPVDGVEIALHDDALGYATEEGEIEIRSRWVRLGYVESPGDLDALRRLGPHERPTTHRTGDLARRLPNGAMLMIGRNDDQVKVAGVRIEPAEIESALLSAPGAVQACVLPRELASGAVVLDAYVQIESDTAGDADALRRHLVLRLPTAMMPATVVVVPHIRTLANGKVDRTSLRDAAAGVAPSADTPRALSDSESAIADIWRHALELRDIGAGDAFMQLGGTSLAALAVVARLERMLGISVPPSWLLANPSLEKFAAQVMNHGSARDAVLQQAPPLGLTSQQARFWFLNQLTGAGDRNWIVFAARLGARADRHALAQAVAHVVERHVLLRSVVVDDEHGPRLVPSTTPLAAGELGWITLDRLELPIGVHHLPPDMRAPFELSHETPLRAVGISTREADYIVFVVHHIAADAWSAEVILQDLDRAYDRASAGEAGGLGEAVPSFETVSSRLAREVDRARASGALDDRVRALSGAPISLALPARRTVPAAEGGCLRFGGVYEDDLSRAMKQFSRQHGLTLPSMLIGAYSLVLAELCGQDEVMIGMPVSLRHPVDESDVVGPLINMLPLRCRIDREVTFGEHCQGILAQLAQGLDHVALPFEDIAAQVAPSRSMDRHPVYQASFSFHDVTGGTTRRWRSMTPVDAESGTISCDVAFTVEQHDGEVRFALDGAHESWHPGLLNRLCDQITWVLGQGTAQPDRRLQQLRLLPPGQRDDLVTQLGRQDTGHRPASSIAESIRESARRHAQAVAIGGRGGMSYSELLTHAEALAGQLRDCGIAPGDHVGVMTSEGVDPAVAQFGILLARAAFVPIVDGWPAATRDSVLTATGARAIVEATPAAGRACSVRILERAPAQQPPAPPGTEPIYAMTTSGTSGTPKVVSVDHRGIANRFAWMSEFFGEGPVVTLQSTPLAFDSSVWQILWPLTRGGRCIVPERGELFDAAAFADLVAREQVSVVDFVPSILQTLLPDFEQSAALRAKLRSLRWVILGAERLPVTLARRLRDVLPEARIVNLYGPTEASIGCVAYEIGGEVPDPVPIGRPISNVQVAVIGKGGDLAPRGALGELVLMGECVAIGYLGTDAQGGFRASAVPGLEGRRAFHTGDVVRWNEDGQLEFHGRTDSQLKIRGVRIEPAGLEALLQDHPAVVAAAVAVKPARGDDDRDELVAFVCTRRPDEFDRASLRQWLRDRLPPEAVPDRIEHRQAFPVRESGKVDIAAMVDTLGPAEGSGGSTTSSDLADAIRSVWRELLQSDESLDDDTPFFEAGGHSLLMLTLRRRLRQSFGVPLAVAELFRNPTVRAQAALVDSKRGG